MGGKKKSTRKAPKKVIKRLPKAFKCPYCDHEGTVEVKMYDVVVAVALLLNPVFFFLCTLHRR
jgi:transcription elongation factor Elf1